MIKNRAPVCRPPSSKEIQSLGGMLASRGRITLLTGAGCSTESGIPDYRSPGGLWKNHKPITYKEFRENTLRRHRYWARSMLGWSRFKRAIPNDAHRALARLEATGLVKGLITQNVDRLHQAAGSETVIELHGDNHHVVCLDCRGLITRAQMQILMESLNPNWEAEVLELRPDGDAELKDGAYGEFKIPPCPVCGGMLKTNVVFFGEGVPKERVEESFSWVEESDLLLVVGSSLTVWSGYRFVKRALKHDIPVVAVNIGPTRADDELTLKVEGRAGDVLPRLLVHLGL